MPSSKPIRGKILRVHAPEWEPLRNLAPDHADDFMWMHEVQLEDGTRLHAYRHYETRRYLHLDHSGSAFAFVGGEDGDPRYEEVDSQRLLDLALGRPDERATIFRQNLSEEFKRLRWACSATKHRISRNRILHVLEHCHGILEEGPPPGSLRAKAIRQVFLGEDSAGMPLEVIAIRTHRANLMVIHAMKLRSRYWTTYEELRRLPQVKDPPEEEKREKIFLESGEEFTPELEAELAAEAERGYDLSKAKLRIRTRPLLPGSPIPEITLRMSQAEFNDIHERAKAEGRSFSEVAHEVLTEPSDP